MLYKTRAIVLKSIRFKEADIITRLFTLEHGILSFHLKGILKSKKSAVKSALFLPFSLLAIDYNFRESKSLQYLKEVKQDAVLSTIHFEISKNAIVTFLTEILNDVLHEKEKDEQLFTFFEQSILHLDRKENHPLFIPHFLIKLTSYLGNPPNTNNMDFQFFDISTACFTYQKIHHEFTIEADTLKAFKQLLGTDFDTTINIQYPKEVRKELLYQILKYYQFHINGYKEPKSLTILEEVFS